MKIINVSFNFDLRFQGIGNKVPDIVMRTVAEQILGSLKRELAHLESIQLDNDKLVRITTGSPEVTGA